MKLLISIFATILVLTNCNMKPHEGELVASDPPVVRLDLNIDPEHRWDNIVPEFKGLIQQLASAIFDPLDLPQSFYTTLGLYFTNFYKYQEFVKEIKGIAKAADVQWQKLLIANFLYEGSTFPSCSSILVRNKENRILHGRNLDFDGWEYMSKLTAKVRVYKGDDFIGEWNQIIGSVIVLTGITYDKFSLTEDTRHYHGEVLDILDNIFVKQYFPNTLLTRYVLQNEFTFNEAADILINTNTTSTIYYIIADNTEGKVIEKNMVGANRVTDISSTSENWYIVQTNYDVDEDPGKDDRKTPATIRLNEIGPENINAENFFELLKKYPTLNVSTVYSVMFSTSYELNYIDLWYGNIDSEWPQLNQPVSQDIGLELDYIERLQEIIKILVEDRYIERILEEHYGIKNFEEFY